MKFCRILGVLLPMILSGCYPMPYPDHHLTNKDSAWGKVKRGEQYVIQRDFLPRPNHSALRDSSCSGVDDVGVLPKGAIIRFTGFCVRRNCWGAQPFVYAEVLSGEYAGKTFYARSLVETAVRQKGKTAWIIDIRKDAVKPL
jgi:hypothetical protein